VEASEPICVWKRVDQNIEDLLDISGCIVLIWPPCIVYTWFEIVVLPGPPTLCWSLDFAEAMTVELFESQSRVVIGVLVVVVTD